MRLSTLLAPVALFACTALADKRDRSDVISLTEATFDSIVKPEPLMLVEFFAPWCGHCKTLAPHYAKAAAALKSKNIKLAKVDCTKEKETCKANDIQGYPTLKVFKKGVSSPYPGARESGAIIAHMIRESVSLTKEVTHEEL